MMRLPAAGRTTGTRPSVHRGASLVLCLAAAGLLAAAAINLARGLAATPSGEVVLAGYSTSLQGRTAGQRHNVRLAAAALNGARIAPGGAFSFNKVVQSWSMDRGYVKAPVSYNGELLPAFGGGVCQVSTTLYNAALLAGLEVLERHPHTIAPRYAPPGLDAAVAQVTIDLRLRNPYTFPLRVVARAFSDRLEVRVFGAELPRMRAHVEPQIVSRTEPERLLRVAKSGRFIGQRAYVRSPGATGFRVVVHRVWMEGSREVKRERLSDDTYAALDRVIAVTPKETTAGHRGGTGSVMVD